MAEVLASVRREPGRGPLRNRSLTVTLTGERVDPRVARNHARRALGSIQSQVADDVLLVVSELVTNAVLHGKGPITLTVTVEPSEVVVAVTDHGSESPSFAQQHVDDEDGRGLRIVQRLTAAWDVERAATAKTITAVVRLHPAD
ncbi:MAG TPA: ATP-binding protein [Mycobacteriales bacterium]|nr:ATP-binding protein [Mycobacteriales bacterium]